MRKAMLGAASLCLVAMVTAAAPAFAGDGHDGRKVVEKRHVVIVGPDGEKKVFEGPAVRRGFLGVGLVDLTPELRRHFGASDNAGVLVSKVDAGGPADKAGVEVGDILVAIDGKPVQTSWDIRSQMRQLDEGERVSLEVRRNNRVQTLNATVQLRERPEIDFGPIFVGKDGDHKMLRLPKDLENLPGVDGKRIRVIHGGEREKELEKQIERLEKRIQELEQKLKN